MTDHDVVSVEQGHAQRASLRNPERELGAFMARATTNLSPSAARAVQATENVWREIETTFDFHSSSQVARLLGRKPDDRAFVSRLRRQGDLLAVWRLNAYKYPGFQFDRHDGHVQPVIADLAGMAKRLGWQPEELVLWLCSPSGYFAGDLPVDHIHEPELLLERAECDFQTEW